MYKRNIESAKQTQQLLNELKAANNENAPPLLLSVDEEGGVVSRMPKPFLKLPTPREIGQTNNTSYAYEIGSTIGEMLEELGFNMNFAPVLDIDSNPNNPIIGKRSYGSGAQIVSDMGNAVAEGLQSNSIVPVVKHFPGHGDTEVDSHLDLPVVHKTLAELEALELIPFQLAIQNGVDAIMIAHILLPELDTEFPASLSSTIIDGLLREKLGYNGVVITDDMTMGGITKHFDIGKAAVQSVLAGSDIILVGHQDKLQRAVIHALSASAADGTLTEERINESVYRILQLKQKYQLEDKELSGVDIERINKKLKEAAQLQAS